MKTCDEKQAGYAKVIQLDTLKLNEVRLMPRFPKWERKDDGRWDARDISDYKKERGVNTTGMKHKYAPEDLTVLEEAKELF